MRIHNDQKFFDDLKRVSIVMAYSQLTKDFFKVLKCDVRRSAESRKIHYMLADDIFVVKKLVFVIL